jgi:hypothetical protein
VPLKPLSIALFCCAAGLAACGETTLSFDAHAVVGPEVDPLPAFADEGGDALFSAQGRPLRVRLDGSTGALYFVPGAQPAASPRGLVAAGPHSALWVGENDVQLISGGWLLPTEWGKGRSASWVGATETGDGEAWIADQQGLYRIRGGVISELRVNDKPFTGIIALAAARGHDGAFGLWISQARGGLSHLVTTGDEVRIRQERMEHIPALAHVTALAGLGDSVGQPGEVWALSKGELFRQAVDGWHKSQPAEVVDTFTAAGRAVWALARGKLFRFDADAERWAEARGLPGTPTELLAADPAGAAWVRIDGRAVQVSESRFPRLYGLDQNETLYAAEMTVRAVLPPGANVHSIEYQLGNGERITAPFSPYSMGGDGPEGRSLPYSLAGLPAGRHMLRATAQYADGTSGTRLLPFEFAPITATTLSWETDIRPIFEARCAKCHQSAGPGRNLSGYTEWQAAAARIAEATRERRMPADGPLEPTLIAKIQRWAQGGALP